MSDGIFSADSPLIRFLNRIADIVILSLLFVIFSAPIFTIGASLSAASYVGIKAVSGDDGYVFRRFWQSFKENFKQATLAWLIMLPIGIVLSFDLYFWVNISGSNSMAIAKPMIVISVILLFLYCMIFVHVFALIGNYENTTKAAFRNAFLIGINKFPATLLLILLYLILIYLIWNSLTMGVIFIICGAGLQQYLMGFIHKKVFQSIAAASEKAREEIKEEKAEQEQTEEPEKTVARPSSKAAYSYNNPAEEDEEDDVIEENKNDKDNENS